jgi:hypothetical protein
MAEFGGVDIKWWIGGGAVGILGMWYLRKTLFAPKAPTTDLTGLDTTSGTSAPTGTSGGYYGYYNPNTGEFVGGGGTTKIISTNAEWAQNVLISMLGSFSDTYDAASIGLGIAKYLAGQDLSDTEFNIVETAIHLYGYPPNPPVPPHKGTPTGPGTTVAGPQNLRVTGANKSWLHLAWDPPPTGTPAIYTVYNVAKNDSGYSVPATMRSMNLQTGAKVPTTVTVQVDATLLDGTRTAKSNVAAGRTT